MLAVAYNCFDGVELLPYAIKQIRPYVDFILIHYQTHSWYGKPTTKEDLDLLNDLKRRKLADMLLYFPVHEPAKTPAEAKVLEKEKRNLSRSFCREKKATHFLDCDTDEFYISEEFKNAKQFLLDNNFDYSAVKIYDYFHLPIYKKASFNSCNVPFICKIEDGKFLGGSVSMGKMDPTRGYIVQPWERHYIFPSEQLVMHHMQGCRKNLQMKYDATSRGRLDRSKIPDIINNIKCITKENIEAGTLPNKFGNIGKDFSIVPNIFEIPLEIFE